MVYIYILQLEQNKYYIGKTANPEFRLDCHFHGNGSAWTKLYKPIKMVELISDCDDYDEDKYTRMYMDKYGIDNVRGGSFVQIKLDKSTIEYLMQLNIGTHDKCFSCGENGHYAKNCKSKWFEQEPKDEARDCITSYFSKHRRSKCLLNIIECLVKEPVCFRCGREGHYSSACYAKKHINGYLI